MKPAFPLMNNDSSTNLRSNQIINELHSREQNNINSLPTDDPLDPKRRERVGFTWDEMWLQPEMIQETLDEEGQSIKEAASYLKKVNINRLVMAGCGDSIAAMISVRYLFESLLHIPCEPIQALDFANFYYHPIDEQTLVIVLSSSGATTPVVESLMIAKSRGAHTLALSNTVGSPLMQEADQKVLIHAQRKGWPTQASTAAMAVLYQLGIEMARHKDIVQRTEIDLLEEGLHKTPLLIAKVLETLNESIAVVAEAEAEQHLYLFTGSGPCYSSAIFGAAKVKELTPDHAEAIQLEEYHHYRSQKAKEPLFIIAPNGRGLERALDTGRQAKRVGGHVYSVVSEGSSLLNDISNASFVLPDMDNRLAPMVYTIPVQLFAYHLAIAKFKFAEEAYRDCI